MATELGKAYVQIIPSAKGIGSTIRKELEPESESAGESVGLKIASKIKQMIKIAAIGKAIKTSLLEGGALEQSLGGIETLFKDNADKVKSYASEAYKTVGVSANEYMENVTSFSASLLQSLSGNTYKAADVANMAMIDMGDNANKMGTDMRDIQNAYQGFAKENYTMLDNLKLGYGGTKSEMERLLADAQKLTGVKYNISNLSDVYNAIHAIQEELGITGTTALEAEETLTGSFAAMKASIIDFLGNLAIGENLKPSLEALAETMSTFLFGNLLPMLINIVTMLPGAVVNFIIEAIPQILTALENLSSQLANWLDGGIPELLNSMENIISKLITVIMNSLPRILAVGGELSFALAKGLIYYSPAIAIEILSLIGQIVITIGKNLYQLVGSGGKMVMAIGEGIKNKASEMYENAKDALKELLEEIAGWKEKFYDAGRNIVESIADGIKSAVNNVTDAIKGVVGEVRDFLPFSPAKRGPLKDLNKLDFGIIADGIYDAENPITKAMESVAQSTIDSFSPAADIRSNISIDSYKFASDITNKPVEQSSMDSSVLELIGALLSEIKTFKELVQRLPDRQLALARE